MMLRDLAGVADPLDKTVVHDARKNGLRTLAELPSAERARVLQTYTKVAFVRDPWSRLLSAYLNKFVEEPEPRRRVWLRELLAPLRAARPSSPTLRTLGRAAPRVTLSFEAFVGVLEETHRALARPPPRGGRRRAAAVPPTNAHWATQSELCALHVLRYDFVGSHAHMRRDAAALSSLLGFDATPPSGAQYGWEGNQNVSRLLARYYTSQRLVERVAQLYAADRRAPLNGVSFGAKEVFRRAA